MADHFLVKTRIDLGRAIEVGGARAVEQYDTLFEQLSAKAGPDVAKLFAEPLVSKGNDQAASTVSWYSERAGQGVPIAKLDPAAQSAVAALLTDRLEAVRGLLGDSEIGPLVSAALYIGGTGDIWSVDGKPVLVNWGLMPEAGVDLASRKAHYAATLGPYLAMDAPPPIGDKEQNSRRSDIAAATAAAGVAAAVAASPSVASASEKASSGGSPETKAAMSQAGAGATGGGGPEEPGAQANARPPRGRVPLIAWLPMVLLLLLFGGVLFWLLTPGNRIFADDGPQPLVGDQDALLAAREINRALEARLAELNGALEGAVCRADGTLLMPDGLTIEGLLPPELEAGRAQGGEIVRADATPVLPPAPDRVVLTPGGDEVSDTARLLDHIDARTAMVIASNGQSFGTGTGFFIGPDLMVTNYHVIEEALPENIFVTNEALGGLRPAQVLKTLGPMREVGADFALLRIPDANQPFYAIRQSAESMRLQSVITAGYPGDVLNSDVAFLALQRGDTSAVPGLTVTDGTVNAEQALSPTTNAVVHSAPISTGNSGGPLLDMCGRVVGVNTFVIQGPLRNLNFALATQDLLAFLDGTPAAPVISSDACSPMVSRPVALPVVAGQ